MAEPIAATRAIRVIDGQDVERVEFSAAAPGFSGRIEMRDGRVQVLHLGAQGPQQSQYYVQGEGRLEAYHVQQRHVLALRRLIAEPPFHPMPVPLSSVSVAGTASA